METFLDANNATQRERLRRLFKVKKTEIEMLSARGYRMDVAFIMKSDRSFVQINSVNSLSNPELTFETFLIYREQNAVFQSRQEFSTVYFRADNPEVKVLVLYLGNEPGKAVSKKDFEIVHAYIRSREYRHIILITETGLNADADSFVKNRCPGYKIEVFLDSQLAFNRTKHALAPITIKHIPASQIANWAQAEEIQPDRLPMIMNTDIIAKWYGGSPMDGFEYEIMGTTTDTAGYYRITRQSTTAKK